MENENENKKINFFTRVKIAVTKLEDYGIFLQEKTSIAVKYFFLIVFILSMVMAIVQTYSITKMIQKGYNYIKNELPDFSFSEEGLQFPEIINAYDEEFDIYTIIDTSDNISDDTIKDYKEQIKASGIIFLKDKAIYKAKGMENEYVYYNYMNETGITSFDKTELIQKFDEVGIMGVAITIFFMLLLGLYIIQLISIFIDWLVITLFTSIVAGICRIKMTFKQVFNIAIYALTLPIILTMFYHIAYYLSDFYIEYFRLIYLLIAYVYVVAVILMIKSDLIKQYMEVSKIVKVQEEFKEEKKTEEEKKEDKNENKKPEKEDDKNDKKETDNGDIAGEPDGSEI